MSNTHTPGKLRNARDVKEWSVSSDEFGATAYTDLTSENGDVVALVVVGEKSPWSRPDPRPNARRLVACWNACDGISTDVLESLPDGLLAGTIPYHELKAQRADLLAALKETWEVLDAAGLINLTNGVQLGQTVWYVKAFDAKTRSIAAIEKAEGGAS